MAEARGVWNEMSMLAEGQKRADLYSNEDVHIPFLRSPEFVSCQQLASRRFTLM